MKIKLALTAMAFSLLGVTAVPGAIASPSVDNGNTNIACTWAKWYMDERQWEYGHRYHDYGFDYHDSMIEDSDTIPEPPKMHTVEQWEGNKKVIRIVPESRETQVIIFDGGRLNSVDSK